MILHGGGVGGGDELILQPDQLSEFRILLKPVSQTWAGTTHTHTQLQINETFPQEFS